MAGQTHTDTFIDYKNYKMIAEDQTHIASSEHFIKDKIQYTY